MVTIIDEKLDKNDSFENAGNGIILIKGAPDILLQRCSKILSSDGKNVDELDEEKRVKLINKLHKYASSSLRNLLLC